jgi:DNA-binding response OmpR family regulator
MPQSLRGRRVLVVEDEPLIGLDICGSLEDAGAHAICLDTLQRALKALKEQAFDAAVLDYRLPDGVSTDICDELERQHIPYVIHTGDGQIDGACARADKVEKPGSVDEIVAHVKRLLSVPPSGPQAGPTAAP